MPRQLTDVIDRMIVLVPEKGKSFLAALTDLKSSATYASPEQQKMWWEEVQDLLIAEFPNPDKLAEWEKAVVDIFIGNAGE